MKKTYLYIVVLVFAIFIASGCNKSGNYPGGVVGVYIPMLDLKALHKGSDLALNQDVLGGSEAIAGVVVSDHSGSNLPAGLLVVQDRRRLSLIRGISVNIGNDAAKYVPGDSVHINLIGSTLARRNGILQVVNINPSAIQKVASGKSIAPNRVNINAILASPQDYESTLITVVKATYNPTLAPTDVLAGEKILNDGTSDVILKTEANATFANNIPPYAGNYTGIVFSKESNGQLVPIHKIRTAADLKPLNISLDDYPDMIITGWMNRAQTTDSQYEYMQFRATKDINFAQTPFSVVTCNNAGATVPTGYPLEGWVTGQAKTYKFELNSGTVKKGDIFYVGSVNKRINGPGSTPFPANSIWIKSIAYNQASPRFNSTQTNQGSSLTNLLANSGNAYGIAVFKGLQVFSTSVPIDVVFVHNGGTLYQPGPAPTYGVGYRIGNTDLYDVVDPITDVVQPYFMSGTNTARFPYNPNASDATLGTGYFYLLGGVFDSNLKKWVVARSSAANEYVRLSVTSTVSEIEESPKLTQIK